MGFRINELTEDAYSVALENIESELEARFYENDVAEFVKSVRVFCDKFDLRLIDVDIQIFSRSYVNIGLGGSWEDDESALEHIRTINETKLEESHGKCSLTGVYTDPMLFDYFVKRGDLVLDDNVEDEISTAINKGLDSFVTDLENTLSSNKNLIEFAEDNEFRFDEDGELVG